MITKESRAMEDTIYFDALGHILVVDNISTDCEAAKTGPVPILFPSGSGIRRQDCEYFREAMNHAVRRIYVILRDELPNRDNIRFGLQ